MTREQQRDLFSEIWMLAPGGSKLRGIRRVQRVQFDPRRIPTPVLMKFIVKLYTDVENLTYSDYDENERTAVTMEHIEAIGNGIGQGHMKTKRETTQNLTSTKIVVMKRIMKL